MDTMDIVIRRKSEQIKTTFPDNDDRIYCDRKWEWGFLRKQCRNLELEPFYKTYTQRLQRSYLSVYFVIQFLVACIHSVILLAAVNDKKSIFPEIFSYLAATILVWISLFITFREDIIRRQEWITYVASFIAIFILVISDLIVPLYHATVNFPIPPLRPAYGSYILNVIYIFIPLSDNWHSFILGMAVTICYLLNYIMVTYRLDEYCIIKTTTEAIFLLCVNFFGIYFRLMKEIAIRTTFLDRRECVEENLLLRYARDQEKSLLLSIIPAHTADDLEKDIRERIEAIKEEKKGQKSRPLGSISTISRSVSVKERVRPHTDKLFVEEHHDVSVLYADVVNYTYLTTRLDVKPLVETLHELFVKFDQASEDYNVLRIKFLGDCYYCVSGVPIKNDQHAKSCVRLGLRMIKDIREVRMRRKLDIDMRIGVHSGSIISGVIGACKWQYDIWSKDVDIASRLEATGVAGRVHVSRETLALLDGEYMYEEGTDKAKEDEVLKKYGIETFLIKMPNRFYDDLHRQSLGARRLIESNRASRTNLESSVHKNFMQNTIEQYNQIRTQTKLEMSRELDKMPIGKFHLSRFCLGSQQRLTQDEMEEQMFRSNVSTVFLFFKEIRWEFLFLKEPDIMLKYSSLIGLITFIGIVVLQGINNPGDLFWVVNGIAAFVLLCFLPITWYKKLWLMLKSPSGETDTDDGIQPKNKISKIFFDISHKIMGNIWFRGFIYLSIVITLTISSLLQLVECRRYKDNPILSRNITSNLPVFYMREHRLCFNPWAITESLVLTISMSFLFVRIPYLFKFFVGVFIVCFFSWIVFVRYLYIYHQSPSTNLRLDAEFSHLLIVLITFGIFHLMDRQTEYIAKIDYNWKRQLQKKQEDAQFTNETVNILVQNILPAHVAEIYMSRKMRDELYTEKYENVAVMFATIKNFDTEKVGLKILNQIICDFDEILTSHAGPLKIEKIKVAGWSYMAACGLDPGRCESTTSLMGSRRISGQRSSALISNPRRSLHNGVPPRTKRLSLDILNQPNNEVKKHRDRKHSSKHSLNVVYVMTEFALRLMKTLNDFNWENFQSEPLWKLRVGISHGEIMAGVVGSSKPLYDIWGNPVNMASRMDSTGIPGRIQVTEETAEVLKTFDIKCECRGLTYVKGRGTIPTYFVDFDENFKFIPASKQNDLEQFPKSDMLLESSSL